MSEQKTALAETEVNLSCWSFSSIAEVAASCLAFFNDLDPFWKKKPSIQGPLMSYEGEYTVYKRKLSSEPTVNKFH